MTDSVSPDVSLGSIAADLRRVADAFDQAPPLLTIDAPAWVHLDIQPGGTDELVVARTDAIAALFGGQARVNQMGNGNWHYDFEVTVGGVQVHLFDGITEATVRDLVRSRELAAKEAELTALRAQVEQLRAAVSTDALGLAYSRADDEPDDPTPVSPARVPLHTGGVTDEGLVDETPVMAASGLTFAADQSRGPLAGTTPVVTYFSFGHGQTDPGTGKSLLDHYVTVVAPTYDACREAMFASRFGQEWSFNYLAGQERTTNWVSRWTEHEVIVAHGTDEAAAAQALAAAMRVLDGSHESESEAR